MRSLRWGVVGLAFILAVILSGSVGDTALGQGFRPSMTGGSWAATSPASAPALVPTNPFGRPGSAYPELRGSDVVPLSSAMFRDFLPRLSNLDFGFLYEFSSTGLRNSRVYGDLIIPLYGSGSSSLFAEVYYQNQGFPGRRSGLLFAGADQRVDFSAGGGYRSFVGDATLLGVNSFFDATRLFGKWYSSGGLGLEMAALLPGSGLIDLYVNQYGNQFGNLQNVIDLWRRGDVSFDVEAGYSQPVLLDGLFDLRVKAVGYQFSTAPGQRVYGLKGGVELTTANGVFKGIYEHGYDRTSGSYNTIGAQVNIGFQPENLFSGRNPFTMPESVFLSPQRNLRRLLTKRVHRNFNLPVAVVGTSKNAGARALPHFVFAANPPFYNDSLAVYTQDSDTHGTYTIVRWDADGVWCGAYSYNVFLVGDTSGLVFPLTVTITPSDWPTWIDQFSVRQDLADFLPEQTIMGSNTDLSKEIPPDGVSPFNPFDRYHYPRIARNTVDFRPGLQGRITISAPGVQTLVIDIVSN